MHPFKRIIEYSSEDEFFEMTIGTLIKGYTFVCETPKVSVYFVIYLFL